MEKHYIPSHRFGVGPNTAKTEKIDLVDLVKTLMKKVELLEEQVQYLSTQTQENQERVDQDIFRIQQKI